MELMSRILRGCAFGTALGMCSPSGAPLDVCAFMCVYGGRQVQPKPCPHLREYVRMCVYGPSGVLSMQKCVHVCLHSARRVPSERFI